MSSKLINELWKALQVDRRIVDALVSSGYETIEEIAYVPVSEIASTTNIELSLAQAVQENAKGYLLTQLAENDIRGERDAT